MLLVTTSGIGDDVDDTRVGGGSVLCRWVGHHFDAHDGAGIYLLEIVFLAILIETRRTVVYEQFHLAHATQTDVAFGVDFNAGDVLQGVRNRALTGFRVADDVIDGGFAFVDEDRASDRKAVLRLRL